MPLQRRLPKRGFTNPLRKEYAVVNLKDLNRFEAGSVVDRAALETAGLVKNVRDGVKLLAGGEVNRPLVVRVDRASRAAAEKIAAAGGKLEVSEAC